VKAKLTPTTSSTATATIATTAQPGAMISTIMATTTAIATSTREALRVTALSATYVGYLNVT
jgi:hypothetical protein